MGLPSEGKESTWFDDGSMPEKSEPSPGVQRAMRKYHAKLNELAGAQVMASQRYESDEVFSLLVDKIQHAMNETALTPADIHQAATFLEKHS
jgi:hypothetical protein